MPLTAEEKLYADYVAKKLRRFDVVSIGFYINLAKIWREMKKFYGEKAREILRYVLEQLPKPALPMETIMYYCKAYDMEDACDIIVEWAYGEKAAEVIYAERLREVKEKIVQLAAQLRQIIDLFSAGEVEGLASRILDAIAAFHTIRSMVYRVVVYYPNKLPLDRLTTLYVNMEDVEQLLYEAAYFESIVEQIKHVTAAEAVDTAEEVYLRLSDALEKLGALKARLEEMFHAET